MIKRTKDSIILSGDTANRFLEQALHPRISPEMQEHLEYVDKNIKILLNTPNIISAEVHYFDDCLVTDLIREKNTCHGSDEFDVDFTLWDTIPNFNSSSNYKEINSDELYYEQLVNDDLKSIQVHSEYIMYAFENIDMNCRKDIKFFKDNIKLEECDYGVDIEYDKNYEWNFCQSNSKKSIA